MESEDVTPIVPALVAQHIDIFVCPACGGALRVSGDRSGLECSQCQRSFGCEHGIPLLFLPSDWEDSKKDVTEEVKAFYEENPFPNYDDLDSEWSLKEKARKGVFARLLDEQIPYGARILEVGCGTGQLSNFLSTTWGRTVFATDICLNSLRLGEGFRQENQLDNVAFLQMNLFRPVFRPGSFDLVICNGVLHHTSDPYLGFLSISRLVRKAGFILIGLYNTYGRIPSSIRRLVFRVSGNRFQFLDPRLRDRDLSDVRKQTWFMDQYQNPHESTHTIGEVLDWFDRAGFEFVNSVPKSKVSEPMSSKEDLFRPSPRGTKLDQFLVQLGLLLSGGREGGFFVMIGRSGSQGDLGSVWRPPPS